MMKLPKFKRRDKRTPLEKEIDAYVEKMSSKRDDQVTYRQMCYNVNTMAEANAKCKGTDDGIGKYVLAGLPIVGTALVCLTNLGITKRVTTFEMEDVITTKAPQFKVPWK